MELALLVGAAVGLRFRLGLVLAATVATIVSVLAWRIAEGVPPSVALESALLATVAMQGAVFLVQIVKAGAPRLRHRGRRRRLGMANPLSALAFPRPGRTAFRGSKH